MSIDIKPGRYYLVQFFFNVPPRFHPPKGGDVMGVVWRMLDEPMTWHLDYRHRYYDEDEPGKIFDSKDKRSWYGGTVSGADEATMLERMKAFVGLMAVVCQEKPDFFLIQGDAEKYIELVRTKPPYWMHIRSVELGSESKLSEADLKQMVEKLK